MKGEDQMCNKILKSIYLLSVLIIAFTSIAHSASFEVQPINQEYPVKVLLRTHTIRGVHYQPMPDTGKPLLVLVHGATYGKWMWDVPGYSWVDHFVGDLGYPVLLIDRLGYGESSHPNGDLLTPHFQAKALKKMLCQIKASQGERPIVWVGHSMGAFFGNIVAGETTLLDGFINIGFLHEQQNMLEGSPMDLLAGDYIFLTDQQRTAAFYYMQEVDQDIIEYDNLHAEPMPRGSIWSGLKLDKLVLGSIKIPVLLVCGEYDRIWKKIDLEAEAALFKNAQTTTFLQKNAGHTNLLHHSCGTLFDKIDNWLATHF